MTRMTRKMTKPETNSGVSFMVKIVIRVNGKSEFDENSIVSTVHKRLYT